MPFGISPLKYQTKKQPCKCINGTQFIGTGQQNVVCLLSVNFKVQTKLLIYSMK